MKMEKRITRRQFLSAFLGVGIGAVAYGTLVEPRWIEITRRQVPLPGKINRPLRLAHISDLHYSPVVPLNYLESAFEKVLDEQPHLICITGDFVSTYMQNEAEYTRLLQRLSSTAPVFACLGNHDGGAWSLRRGGYLTTETVHKLLKNSGITLLSNDTRQVDIGGTVLRLTGLGDWWAGEMDVAAAFPENSERNGRIPEIVLSHNPDTKEELCPHPWDLLLCGHTHGGQIRMPLLGVPFAPVSDKRFVEGLHRWEGRWLHISRGIGNVRGVRFNCRPEISILQLSPN